MAADTKHEEKVTTKEIAVLELVTFSVGEKKTSLQVRLNSFLMIQ